MTETLFDVPGSPEYMHKSAHLSDDGLYRYRLGRVWGDQHHVLTWVMLNPSIADHTLDDPTIRRCIGFARAWGYGGLEVVNLYAFRATKPDELWKTDDPVGPKNDDALRATFMSAAHRGAHVIAAWGVNAEIQRTQFVATLARAAGAQLQALSVTKSGQPGHPLYLPGSATPVPWTEAIR